MEKYQAHEPMRLGVWQMHGAHGALQKKSLFVTFLPLENPLFWPKTGGNFPYKYRLPHS